MAKNEKISLGENVSVPVHVGVIMDGNGRWAKKRGLPRKFGHQRGRKDLSCHNKTRQGAWNTVYNLLCVFYRELEKA